MAGDPQSAQIEQAFLALVARMNAQLIPDIAAKLEDRSLDDQAAFDAALTQTAAVEKQLATVHVTATEFGVNPTGPLGQRVVELAAAIRRARTTIEESRNAPAELKPAPAAPPAPAPPPPPRPITAEDVLKQLRESTDPGQMMFNAESALIEEQRAAIDAITARTIDSFKKR